MKKKLLMIRKEKGQGPSRRCDSSPQHRTATECGEFTRRERAPAPFLSYRSVITLVLSVAALLVCFNLTYAREKTVRSVGGVNIPQVGLVIDASYDPRLDSFLLGYKVINVAVMNQSLNIIYLNPEKDKWWIKFAGAHKRYQVIHDLRSYDPKAWALIPERAKGLVSYPLVLPVGARQVIDLFVPADIDVERFDELQAHIKSLGMKLEIVVRQ